MGQNASRAGVVVWGNPDAGQLGFESPEKTGPHHFVTPRLLEKIPEPVQLAAGGHTSAAVTATGLNEFENRIKDLS